MEFPEILYVKIEKSEDDSFFVCDGDVDNLSELNETIQLAQYKLVEHVKAKNTTIIEK